jgi:Tetracyclin repressor-like, C-terminal domain
MRVAPDRFVPISREPCRVDTGHILGFTLWQLGHSTAATDLGDPDTNDFAATFVRELRAGDYPHLAQHIEQHLTAPTDNGKHEFEFGLDLILEGLAKARQSGRPTPHSSAATATEPMLSKPPLL